MRPGQGSPPKKAWAALAVAAVALLALVVLPAIAEQTQQSVNTVRVMPGARTADQRALAAAAESAVGKDYVTSDNVKFVKNFPLSADGVGGRVVGHYLYVTTTKGLEIYDISKPEDPQMVGERTLDVEFENEQVPTNGSVLGISGQTPSVTGQGVCPSTYPATGGSGCLVIFDVRDKAAPKQVATVLNAGDHTSTCILDCQYMYGSSGSIVDLRGVLGPDHKATKLGTNWQTYLKSKGYRFDNSCHHQVEIRPGVIATACQPAYILSVRPEDGGSIEAPVVLGAAAHADKRFTHGVEWAQGGTDKILLTGGETNFKPTCDNTRGAFSTFRVSGTQQHPTFTFADEVRPKAGNYTDGNPPDGTFHMGCSTHWFEPHQTFDNGGLVALASYENGTRFEQIGPDGKITERGFFMPIDGATSAPHWAPDGRTVYAIDYQRGIDVLRWEGPLYVPAKPARLPRGKVCVVPNLKGKTVKQSKRILKRKHCRAGRTVKRFSSTRRGRVKRTSPKAGRRLKAGSKVALVVSRGRKPRG